MIARLVGQQRKHSAAHRAVLCAASGGYGSSAREPNYDSVSFRQDSGASASTSAVIDVTDESQVQTRMEEVKDFLKAELDRIFTDGVSGSKLLSFQPVSRAEVASSCRRLPVADMLLTCGCRIL